MNPALCPPENGGDMYSLAIEPFGDAGQLGNVAETNRRFDRQVNAALRKMGI
jgi:hypothetical protein